MGLNFDESDLQLPEEIEAGENIAELIAVNEYPENNKVKFNFEVNGKILAEYCDNKLNGSNRLSEFIEGMTGKNLQRAITGGFSLEDQTGKLYKVEIEKNESQGRIYDNVVKIYHEVK